MAKKTSAAPIASRPGVADLVVYDYGGVIMPAIVEAVDDEGHPTLTGFKSGRTVHLPHCKDGSWRMFKAVSQH